MVKGKDGGKRRKGVEMLSRTITKFIEYGNVMQFNSIWREGKKKGREEKKGNTGD